VQDIMAFGAIQAIGDAGLSVPGDIAVAGFDDIEIAELCRPPITTISQPFYELGSMATKMLVAVIKGEITDGQDLYLKHELIVRGSTVQ
jgi:DNA-binding LacI/PurR family transcriptional regulator